MTDKREKLREKIAAGEAREQARTMSRRAADAADQVTAFAREHPFLLLAGGLAVGAALSALVPRSPTRKLSKKSLAFLASAAELGLSYGRDAVEAAEDAGRQGKDRLTDRLTELGSTARGKATDAFEQVSSALRH